MAPPSAQEVVPRGIYQEGRGKGRGRPIRSSAWSPSPLHRSTLVSPGAAGKSPGALEPAGLPSPRLLLMTPLRLTSSTWALALAQGLGRPRLSSWRASPSGPTMSRTLEECSRLGRAVTTKRRTCCMSGEAESAGPAFGVTPGKAPTPPGGRWVAGPAPVWALLPTPRRQPVERVTAFRIRSTRPCAQTGRAGSRAAAAGTRGRGHMRSAARAPRPTRADRRARRPR
jgi:hypothetical protein